MMVKSEPLSANYLAQKRRRKQRKVMLGQEKFAPCASTLFLSHPPRWSTALPSKLQRGWGMGERKRDSKYLALKRIFVSLRLLPCHYDIKIQRMRLWPTPQRNAGRVPIQFFVSSSFSFLVFLWSQRAGQCQRLVAGCLTACPREPLRDTQCG